MLGDPSIMECTPEMQIQRFALAALHCEDKCQWFAVNVAEAENPEFLEDGPTPLLMTVTSFPCDEGQQSHMNLWLQNNNLQGELADEMCLLTPLRSISMAFNEF